MTPARPQPVSEARGLVAAALAAAGRFLLDPADWEASPQAWAPSKPRSVVAVFGLAPGCGATTVARALGVELARRDGAGAAVVVGEARAAAVRLGTPASSRLVGALEDLPRANARAAGRLCLIAGVDAQTLVETGRELAHVVLDTGSAALGGVPACLADHAVLVTTPSTEPALVRVAAECLARVGPPPILVVNRVRPNHAAPASIPPGSPDQLGSPAGIGLPAQLAVPESRVGAQMALSGRDARGAMRRAIAELADLCEGAP